MSAFDSLDAQSFQLPRFQRNITVQAAGGKIQVRRRLFSGTLLQADDHRIGAFRTA